MLLSVDFGVLLLLSCGGLLFLNSTLCSYKKQNMTVGAGISLSDGRLTVFGNCVLHDVHENVVITPRSGPGDAMINGAFIGVGSDHKGSRRVFPIGKLQHVHLHSSLNALLFFFSSLLMESAYICSVETRLKLLGW